LNLEIQPLIRSRSRKKYCRDSMFLEMVSASRNELCRDEAERRRMQARI
jgi:hypothetical protein